MYIIACNNVYIRGKGGDDGDGGGENEPVFGVVGFLCPF